MKKYNLIKNIYVASVTANLYYGYIVDSIGMIIKWIGTLCVFGVVLALMTYADKWFFKRRKERNQKVIPTMEMRA